MNLGLFEEEFSALDTLPETLYALIITHTHGPLLCRARGIMQWREKLLAGQLPAMDDLCWPEESVRKTLLMRVETLELHNFCQGQESLTDSVLQDICEGVSSADDHLEKTANKFNDTLAQRQNIKDKDSSFRDEEGIADHVKSQDSGPQPHKSEATDNHQQSKTPAKSSHQEFDSQTGASESLAPADPAPHAVNSASYQATNKSTNKPIQKNAPGEETLDELQEYWQSLSDSWQELSDIDRQIDRQSKAATHGTSLTSSQQGKRKSLPGRGWDLSTGLLSSQGWRDIIRYRQRIVALPELIHFIDAIGREKNIVGSDKLATVDNRAKNLSRSKGQDKGQGQPKIPRRAPEMDGIERGDDINRMLPSELALLCHPILKTLWHAKRAERLLLLYQHQDKLGRGQKDLGLAERQGALDECGSRGKSSLGRGPIIICLDTSGSMQGEPEHIAKAAVLEALKIAHREQRACHLFTFSGPQQTTFHPLDLRRGGLIELLKFLQLSFHGGTDFPQVLKLALQQQAQEGWGKADILLVTDGRFPLEQKTLKGIAHYRKNRGLRVFGILTGNWQLRGIQAFCDDTLQIRG